MHILLVTPRPPTDNAGNETTSARWGSLLADLGHDVDVVYNDTALETDDVDLLVALHAWRSDEAIETFLDRHPDRPAVVALTGTDLYKYRDDHAEVDTNIDRADALVALQDEALDELDESDRARARVVPQSIGALEAVDPLDDPDAPAPDPDSDCLEEGAFNVCFAAHLRDVKDPLRTAQAVRHLDDDSGIHVTHVGRALSDDWEQRAREETDTNPRYDWHGEVPRDEALDAIAGADLLTSTSILEGGPNVVSEAIALGTPVIASEIPGHTGLLGPDYPGYFPVEDDARLAELLRRAETDDDVYDALVEAVRERAARFTPERERRAWAEVLDIATS